MEGILCKSTVWGYQSEGKNIQKEEAVTEEEGIGTEEVAAAIAKLKGGKVPVCVELMQRCLKLEEVYQQNGCMLSST